MKTLHALLIPLLSVQLIYAEKKEIIVPPKIQSILCQKLSTQGCNKERTLIFDHTFKLKNNRSLLFSHLENKDSLYVHGYKNIPLIVDKNHKWTIINNLIEAEIQNVLKDPYGGIWIHALWMIEGVSPLVYYSKDGLKWQQISLPKNEEYHGTFEDLELCFLKNSVLLRFNNLDNTEQTKVWETQYQAILNKNPLWKRVTNKEKLTQKCLQTSTQYNTKDSFLSLTNKELKEQTTPLPCKISKPITAKPNRENPLTYFSLQLGTFQQKSSIDTLYKQMNHVPDTLIQREFILNGKKVNKVFIGYFTTHDEAKNKLIFLRKKYPDNLILKNAFITKLK